MRLLHISRRDWLGDSIVVMVCGTLLIASMALPWANARAYPRQNFTYSLVKPNDIEGVLFTEWGPPIVALGVAVIALGAAMLIFGPRRWTTQPVAFVLTVSGLAILAQTGATMHAIYHWGYAAGVGVLVALIIGVILPVVALATAMTGRILRAAEATPGESAGQGPALPGPGDQVDRLEGRARRTGTRAPEGGFPG
jgi:hypothetical protein